MPRSRRPDAGGREERRRQRLRWRRNSLAAEPVAGTILVVADDLGGADAAAIRQAAGRNSIAMLAGAAARPASGCAWARCRARQRRWLPTSSALERRIETRFQAAQGDAFGTQWRDEGYWLLLPVALLGLLWFRRGTTVPWVLLFFCVAGLAGERAGERRVSPTCG